MLKLRTAPELLLLTIPLKTYRRVNGFPLRLWYPASLYFLRPRSRSQK